MPTGTSVRLDRLADGAGAQPQVVLDRQHAQLVRLESGDSGGAGEREVRLVGGVGDEVCAVFAPGRLAGADERREVRLGTSAQEQLGISGAHFRHECRDQEVPQDQPGALVELLAEAWVRARDALAPSLRLVGLDANEHADLLGLDPEARPEGSHQRKPDEPQLRGSNDRHDRAATST